MESLMLSEEWLWSNVLTTSDLFQVDELQAYNDGVGASELIKDSLRFDDQLNKLSGSDSGINNDFDSWLNEATCISNLDASLSSLDEAEPLHPAVDVLADLDSALETSLRSPIGSFQSQDGFLCSSPAVDFHSVRSPIQSPSSPIEMRSIHAKVQVQEPVVKYVQASTIDVSGLNNQSQIVMDDLNVLHLPEQGTDEAAMLLLEALAGYVNAGDLNVTEIESLLSSPPSSPEAMVPNSEVESSEYEDYEPPTKRGKGSNNNNNSRSLKSLKPSERKERKKVQNKNAATKYRLKKRAEDESARQEFDQLESRNVSLKRRVDELSSEIKYMKGLLNEVLKGKGLRIT